MDMKHNIACENAKPKSKCKCRCGGLWHGTSNMQDKRIDERTINENLGGEVAEVIKKLVGKSFVCSCEKEIFANGWLGYQHEGGLADKDGKKWWIYIECPYCEYCWSWHKVEVEVNRPRG